MHSVSMHAYSTYACILYISPIGPFVRSCAWHGMRAWHGMAWHACVRMRVAIHVIHHARTSTWNQCCPCKFECVAMHSDARRRLAEKSSTRSGCAGSASTTRKQLALWACSRFLRIANATHEHRQQTTAALPESAMYHCRLDPPLPSCLLCFLLTLLP